jgi:transglutaminase/protease-like cytokinesis protein 3
LLKKFDYRFADSVAINFPKKKYNSFTAITAPLCERINTEHEKFRVIFRWITENIEYNKSATNISDPDKIVRKNKAVCMGFSSLLKEMCNSVGIDCDTISGYTKTEMKDVGKKLKKTDHAWNAVKLYNRWYLVDVTWATSKYNTTTNKFERKFDEHYFITPPDIFILDHFPEEKKWQLLNKYISKRDFINAPLYYADYYHFGCNNLSLKKGKFRQSIKKPVEFFLSSETKITEAGILINYDQTLTQLPVNYDASKNLYSFSFYMEKPGNYDITLFLNNMATLEFFVKILK